MILHLIRHGETLANENHLYCGHTDLSLSPRGIRSLQELKGRFTFPTGDLWFSSGLIRCWETLHILYEKQFHIVLPDLREFHFGSFEMQSYHQLRNNPNYIFWLENLEEAACPEGESKAQFTQRVLRGFAAIQAYPADTVVVITHGGVIGTWMDHIFPGIRSFYQWQPTCGNGYTVDTNLWEYRPLITPV